jgi:hypothetical protein
MNLYLKLDNRKGDMSRLMATPIAAPLVDLFLWRRRAIMKINVRRDKASTGGLQIQTWERFDNVEGSHRDCDDPAD